MVNNLSHICRRCHYWANSTPPSSSSCSAAVTARKDTPNGAFADAKPYELSQSKITPRPLTQPPIELTTSRYALGSTPSACLAARPPPAHTRIREVQGLSRLRMPCTATSAHPTPLPRHQLYPR
ncbi:hypothetical protein B0H19DRAFT_1258318 [Mycena capillaripes]|nr:hypothetical protein B0H19DRAFT_1258318 [Mycena capillaripes]